MGIIMGKREIYRLFLKVPGHQGDYLARQYYLFWQKDEVLYARFAYAILKNNNVLVLVQFPGRFRKVEVCSIIGEYMEPLVGPQSYYLRAEVDEVVKNHDCDHGKRFYRGSADDFYRMLTALKNRLGLVLVPIELVLDVILGKISLK